MPELKFFRTKAELRKWLIKNHTKEKELWVGLYKKSTGKPSITWPELVDEVLCCGWIDGIRKGIDSDSYKIRITPRRPNSIWSAINIKRIGELTKLELMQAQGLKVFNERNLKKANLYSFENRDKKLSAEYEKKFKANKKAWKFFKSQAPWYQKTASFLVMSAKQEETRKRRLMTLIKDSEEGKTIKQLTRN